MTTVFCSQCGKSVNSVGYDGKETEFGFSHCIDHDIFRRVKHFRETCEDIGINGYVAMTYQKPDATPQDYAGRIEAIRDNLVVVETENGFRSFRFDRIVQFIH